MKLLIIILLSFLAIEALVLPLKGPRREDVKRFLKKRFEDNDAEPKPTADFLIGSSESWKVFEEFSVDNEEFWDVIAHYGQRVELSLDFTTRDTWVVDANCGNELCYMGTIGFDATQSTTFSNSSLPFKGFFYDELDAYHPVSGFAVMDKIQLSTYPQNDDKWISVFALVNKRDSNTTMGNWPYYGVVGLAPSPGDMLDPVLPHLLQNYDQKVLTIWMHNDGGFQFFEGFYPGSYEFDWLDNCDNTTYFTVPTTETNTWRFVINGVMIGNYSRAKDENAEINAQTMLTGVPTIVYNSIVALTGAKPGNSDLLNIDCRKEYPDLTLNLGSKNLTVPSEVYISTDMENGARVCRLLLYPTNATGFNPAWKLSYLWFYEMCFHFNLTPPSVGFSQQTW